MYSGVTDSWASWVTASASPSYRFKGLPVGSHQLYVCAKDAYNAKGCEIVEVAVSSPPAGFKPLTAAAELIDMELLTASGVRALPHVLHAGSNRMQVCLKRHLLCCTMHFVCCTNIFQLRFKFSANHWLQDPFAAAAAAMQASALLSYAAPVSGLAVRVMADTAADLSSPNNRRLAEETARSALLDSLLSLLETHTQGLGDPDLAITMLNAVSSLAGVGESPDEISVSSVCTPNVRTRFQWLYCKQCQVMLWQWNTF